MLVSQEISRMYKMDDPIQEYTDQIKFFLKKVVTLHQVRYSKQTVHYISFEVKCSKYNTKENVSWGDDAFSKIYEESKDDIKSNLK